MKRHLILGVNMSNDRATIFDVESSTKYILHGGPLRASDVVLGVLKCGDASELVVHKDPWSATDISLELEKYEIEVRDIHIKTVR